MALTHSKYTNGAFRIPVAEAAGQVVAIQYVYTYDVSETSDGDILELGVLPANHRVVDAILDVSDVDTGTDFEIDIGLMSGNVGEALDAAGDARTCGDELFDGATTGQTAGVARMTERDGFAISPVAYDRSIGIKFVDQGTADGTIKLTVFYGT